MNAPNNIASSVWQPASLFINNQSSQNVITPINPFTINVVATSANGCIDSATQLVTIYSANNLFVPNTFVPDKIGNLDISTLKVYGTNIKSAEIKIFDQWGEMVFQSKTPNTIGWDGIYGGKKQPSGVYIYNVKVVFQNNQTQSKSGAVNLIR